ncbi:hypothetical protein EXQ31_13475 [Clostridium botulinum]|uniref:hypothetical protein n=1 Tax=Clostridium botulinum TaxID=1491 RepID=UPI0005861A2B|nr:hypothetical protein [Clostridium botulinum]AJE13226.1 hypothetical protein T259_4284 [Clostridium botulinum CDC_1436]MBO0526705.1 hypothetical protein [Clostridium botulinum]MBO0527015.1 hypothetical protein [Clostridium botulinum]MBO0532472.1 hypothetical protein [Clostridium botulinum]MBO0534417.1 hypothetical protein [Clostridium botulinum]
MSFGAIIETKQCSCGKLYETNCETLGVNRKECGMCDIANRIEEPKEIASLIYYVVSKSNIQGNDLKQITRNLLKSKLADELIELGLEDRNLTEIRSILDSDSPYMMEVRRDLLKYLKEYDNINDFIRTLLLRQENTF